MSLTRPDSLPDAASLLRSWTGRTIATITGAPNTILGVTDTEVIVGTGRSPQGSAIPLTMVQPALDLLSRDGEVEISVEAIGHRSRPRRSPAPSAPPRHVTAIACDRELLCRRPPGLSCVCLRSCELDRRPVVADVTTDAIAATCWTAKLRPAWRSSSHTRGQPRVRRDQLVDPRRLRCDQRGDRLSTAAVDQIDLVEPHERKIPCKA